MNATAPLLVIVILALIVFFASLRLCNEWQRKVVLRLGRFAGVRGPGIFFLLPFVETTPFTIDMRVKTSTFTAEQTLTRDGASVTVDTLVYWRVVDAGRAAIQVVDYTAAVLGAAQGALRTTRPSRGASRSSPSRSATSRCRTTCKMRCRGWHRPSGNGRRGSSSARAR